MREKKILAYFLKWAKCAAFITIWYVNVNLFWPGQIYLFLFFEMVKTDGSARPELAFPNFSFSALFLFPLLRQDDLWMRSAFKNNFLLVFLPSLFYMEEVISSTVEGSVLKHWVLGWVCFVFKQSLSKVSNNCANWQ